MKFIIILIILAFNGKADTVYVSGLVESLNTQHVLMPLVPSFQGKVSEMAEEGSKVKTGDFLLRADGSSIISQIDSQIEQLQVFKATAKKDKINLKIELNNKSIAYDKADTNLKIAQMKAEVPLDYIGELAYKQNILKLKNSEKIYDKSINDLQEVKIKIEKKHKEIALGIVQKQNKLDYLQETLSHFTIYANQDGYVIYSTKPWSGEKIQVGDQMNSGREVLSVSEKINLQIIAWVNAIDIPKLKMDQLVNIQFDAYLGKSYQGKISQIASGGEDKQVWGDALYYKTIISPNEELPNNLMLGMSALIEITFKEKNHD